MKYAVKLGGSAIAPKDIAYIAREDVIARLAQELARSGEQCLVVHGGGSFGHAAATEHGMISGALDGPKARYGTSERSCNGWAPERRHPCRCGPPGCCVHTRERANSSFR